MSKCPFNFSEGFTPPYPKPHKTKLAGIRRFLSGIRSSINVISEKSYNMKMGEVHTPLIKAFIVNQKELVNQVMLNRKGEFPKHHLQHEMLQPLLGESVFSTNGEKWREQREMVNPAFAHANLRKVFEMMQTAATELANDITGEVEIDPIMTHITADIIFRTILSKQLGKEEAHQIYIAFNKYQAYSAYYSALRSYFLPSFLMRWKMRKQAELIHKVFAPISKERHDEFHKIIAAGNTPPNNDILDALMSAKSSKTGDYFSYRDIIDQLSIIFLAGHETSASSLTWSLYLLSKCPNLQENLFAEVKSVIKDGKICFDDLKKLEGINSLFNESLRLYPPVSFLPREATKPLEMRGKKIMPKDMITVAPWLLHRNKNYWHRPHDFKPERWFDDSEKESIKDCFIPFGKGERICIGAGFARQEAILILAHLIYNFRITLPQGQKIKVISRLTTRPKNPIRLQFTKR